jgi:hypothetical protein
VKFRPGGFERNFGGEKVSSTNLMLGFTNVIVGILFVLISIPLVLGKIRMNPVYGVRFKKSFESEANWYKINAYGGKQLIGWSLPLILLGGLTFFLPLDGKPIWVILIACAPLIVLVPAVKSYLYAKKL